MPGGQASNQFAADAPESRHTFSSTACPVEVLGCQVLEITLHPRLPDRRIARVRVQVSETFGGFQAEHQLQLRLHVNAPSDFTNEQVHNLVLDAASRVLQRLMTDMEAGAARSDPTDRAIAIHSRPGT